MALKGLTVSIPDKRIIIRHSGKYDYVYYTVRAYRRSDGKPTSETAIIGKVIPDKPDKMIPNERYFEFFKDTEETIDHKAPKLIENYGTTYVIHSIFKKLKLTDLLENIFLTNASLIEICATYILCKGAVMSYIDDWCENNYNQYHMLLTSQTVSRLLPKITLEHRYQFFRDWAQKRIEQEYIAYDVTSISSYSTNINSVEWGYNRDNEELPQINLGMYYGETSNLPIYYNSYYGSITDKEHLQFMMDGSKKLGIDNVKFVMDKGFYKKENIRYMVENKYPFIICLSNSSIYAKKLIKESMSSIRNSKYVLENNSYFGMILPKKQDEISYNMHIIFNSEKENEETCLLFGRIEKYKDELSKMTKLPSKISKYEKYFKIRKNFDNSFTFEKDHDKINEEMTYAGYIVFLTTDLSLTTDDLLKIYRKKDVVEKCFDNLKNELDLKRLRIHSDNALEGKMFITFIALILRSYLEQAKTKNKQTNDMTVERIIMELDKLKIVTYQDDKKMLTPFTSKQKDILNCLDISMEEITESIKNISKNS